MEEVERRLASVRKFNDDLQADIKKYTDGIEQNNQAMMELLNSKGTIQSKRAVSGYHVRADQYPQGTTQPATLTA